jgi:hypothetical protein
MALAANRSTIALKLGGSWHGQRLIFIAVASGAKQSSGTEGWIASLATTDGADFEHDAFVY